MLRCGCALLLVTGISEQEAVGVAAGSQSLLLLLSLLLRVRVRVLLCIGRRVLDGLNVMRLVLILDWDGQTERQWKWKRTMARLR